MIRVFDPENVCIEEYESWEEAARAFLKMLNQVEHENYTIDEQTDLPPFYTIDERPSLQELIE